jgi:hypothetical protein
MRMTPALRILAIAVAFPAAVAGAQDPPPPSNSVSVPLNEQTGWQVLQYSNLPPHRIRFSKAGLEPGWRNSMLTRPSLDVHSLRAQYFNRALPSRSSLFDKGE